MVLRTEFNPDYYPKHQNFDQSYILPLLHRDKIKNFSYISITTPNLKSKQTSLFSTLLCCIHLRLYVEVSQRF